MNTISNFLHDAVPRLGRRMAGLKFGWRWWRGRFRRPRAREALMRWEGEGGAVL